MHSSWLHPSFPSLVGRIVFWLYVVAVSYLSNKCPLNVQMPFSLLGDMVIQQTFLTPTGLFLISMAIMYLITALLHPEEFCMFIIIVLSIISHFLCDVASCHVTFFGFVSFSFLQSWLSMVWCISSASPVDISFWPSTRWLTWTMCPGAQGKPTSNALF